MRSPPLLAILVACASPTEPGPLLVPTFMPLTVNALDALVRACPPPRKLQTQLDTLGGDRSLIIECPGLGAMGRRYDGYYTTSPDFRVVISGYSLDFWDFTIYALDPERRADIASMIVDLAWPAWRDPLRAALAESFRMASPEGLRERVLSRAFDDPRNRVTTWVAGRLSIEAWTTTPAVVVENYFARWRQP